MTQWLKDGVGSVKEPAFETEYEEELYATPTGQLATSFGGSVGAFNLKRFANPSPARPVADLRNTVIALTRYEASGNALEARTRNAESREGYHLESLVYHTGPGRHVPALLGIPETSRDRRKTVLHTSDRSAADAFAAGGDLDELVRSGYTVLAIDVSGRGETVSTWRSFSDGWFAKTEKEAWLAMMTGRTLAGIRADDIIRGLDLLAGRGLLHGAAAIGFAKGLAGVDLLHAATIDSRFTDLALEDMLVSYRAAAQSPVHRQLSDVVVPGVLSRYDLQDLVAARKSGSVSILNARSPVGPVVPLKAATAEYHFAIEALARTPARLRIGLRREGESVFRAYPKLK